jgi:hypothetical protein
MRPIASLLATAALFGAVLLPAAVQAQIKERTLRFPFQNVADHPQGKGAAKFAEILKEKSGGKLNVRLFPGGQLGGDLQTVSSLQGGTLDVTVLNAGLLVGLDKRFAVLDFPSCSARRRRPMPSSTAPSARSCMPAWRTRASSGSATGNSAFATSPIPGSRSPRSRISRA